MSRAESRGVAAELLGSSKRLDSATAINRVLSRLFDLVACNRIPPRQAAILAYIGQLLLLSLPMVRKERQLKEASDTREAVLEALLTRAAADLEASADTPLAAATPNSGGSQSALPDSEHARRDTSESAHPSPAIETSVVYRDARSTWERP